MTGITSDDGSVLDADLVVDATGRPARSVRWLSDLGYEEPPVSVVHVDVAYASRILRRDPSGSGSWWTGAMVMAGPPSGRLGVVSPLEDGTLMVTLAGLHGDHPPRDDAGFLAFARSLPASDEDWCRILNAKGSVGARSGFGRCPGLGCGSRWIGTKTCSRRARGHARGWAGERQLTCSSGAPDARLEARSLMPMCRC